MVETNKHVVSKRWGGGGFDRISDIQCINFLDVVVGGRHERHPLTSGFNVYTLVFETNFVFFSKRA